MVKSKRIQLNMIEYFPLSQSTCRYVLISLQDQNLLSLKIIWDIIYNNLPIIPPIPTTCNEKHVIYTFMQEKKHS